MVQTSIKINDLGLYDLPNYGIDVNGNFSFNNADIYKFLINKNYLYGSYAIYMVSDDGSIFMARDSLGTRKLFFAFDSKSKCLTLSSNFIKLGREVGFDKVLSVPAGGFSVINPAGSTCHVDIKNGDTSEFNINRVVNRLKLVFKNFAMSKNDSAIVCLSGGLDSTLIAYLAREYFKKITAVSAVFLDVEDYINYQKNDELPSSKYVDFDNAKMIADYLGISFEPIFIPKSKILENLKDIMYSSQDWRDFNVHCAVLNYSIAKYIKKSNSLKNSLILTGDFMNEAFADYTSEVIDDEEYYPQPNISKLAKQRFLLKGLDSSDRELGVFANLNLNCIQPYACVVDEYRKLSLVELEPKESKYQINGSILPQELLNLVGKNKVRAQSGDLQGGILGYFVKNGLHQKNLTQQFLDYFECSEDFLKTFIYVGSYRSEYL